MNMYNTKAELLAEVKKLENALKSKEAKLEQAKMRLARCEYEEFKVLFEVSHASNLYISELRDKTSLIRISVQDWDDVIVYGEHRQFKDGNKVILMFHANHDKEKELVFKSALFLRRVKVL